MAARVIVCWLAAVALGPQPAGKPDLLIANATAQLEQRDFRSAIRTLELAEQTAPRSTPEIYVLLATAHLNLREQDAAFDACRRGLTAIPASARLERYFVSVVSTLDRPEDRARRLEEALNLAPQSPYLQMALGRVLADADWHNLAAEGLLRSAARKLPQDPEARYRYADWLCSHEKNEECVAEITAALALDPANLVARMQGHAYLANAQNGLDHADAAERAYRRSLEINVRLGWPNLRVPTYFARFLAEHGREKEAERVLDDLVRRAPDCGPAHRELARLYADTGRFEQAVVAGRRALAYAQGAKEDERALHLILAKALFALGRNEEAAEHQAWVKANPH